MAYEKAFSAHTTEEQIQICQEMACRWRRAGRLLERRAAALTPAERTALNAQLAGLRDEIAPDTNSLLPGA